MKHAFKTLVGAAAVASIVAAAGTASAGDPATKCHQTIAKNIAKYQATVAKGIVGCHKSRSGGKTVLGSDCNVTNVTGQGADQKGKRLDNRAGAKAKIVDTCTGQASILALYTACPSPNAATIASFDNVADCLLNLSESYLNDIGERAMGNPATPASLSDAAKTCQGNVGKALSKFVKTVGGSRAKCKANEEKINILDLNYDGSCANSDPSGKIAPALAALNAAYDTCPPADHDDLGLCDSNLVTKSIAALKACAVTKIANPLTNGLAAASQELPGQCAGVADVTINAANGTVVNDSETRLDSGWKGTAHQVDVIDQSVGAVTLSGCDADCRNCDVTHNAKNGNCRCESDATRVCNVIEGNDNDPSPNGCQGLASQACHCMFGPPLAVSASATPVCIVNRFAQEFNGTTGEVGEYTVGTRTRALVHTGISQTQPCPVCNGDANPNSGDHTGGTCKGGPRNNLACDENAEHPDFGPSSFDCPPSPGANISGSGLNLNLVFQSGASSIAAAIPAAGTACDGASAACHCSVCSGDSQVGCANNTDCSTVGAGTCGVALANNPKQNNCDTSCTNDGNGNGQCDGPILDYCSGFLNGFGKGIITCANDGDCDANDCNGDNSLTPGECGTCTLSQFAQCFLPTVSATGEPGIYESKGVSVFCSGQTGNSGVDNAGGLPGPGRVQLSFDFDLFCANGTTPYQLPEGANCEP
jgi:hypothetical protein